MRYYVFPWYARLGSWIACWLPSWVTGWVYVQALDDLDKVFRDTELVYPDEISEDSYTSYTLTRTVDHITVENIRRQVLRDWTRARTEERGQLRRMAQDLRLQGRRLYRGKHLHAEGLP